MAKRIFLFCWIIFLGVSFADERGDERKELQRLFITERASSQQDKGEWQFNADFEYRHDSEMEQYMIPIGLEYGILDWLELEAGIPYVWQEGEDEDSSGIGDLGAGLTFLLVRGNKKEIPHIAAGIEIGLPTASEEEQYSYEGFINMTKYFPSFIIDLNISYSQSRNGEIEDEIEFNLGSDFLAGKTGWHLVTEFNGETNLSEDVNEFYLTPGIKYVTKGGLELGLGAPIGLVSEADDYRIIASLTYEWGGENED